MNTTPIDFSGLVQTTASIAGQNIFGVIGAVLPFVLPVLAGLWGVRYALGKIGLN